MSKGNFDLVRLLWQRKVRRTRKMQKVSGVPPLQYSAKKQGTLKNYRIYGNTVNGENVGDLITEGEHAGEYSVPVTVEGKNLLPNTATNRTINGVAFTVNNDGSVTCNGTATQIIIYTLNDTFSLEPGTYKLTGCPAGGGAIDKYKLDIVAPPTTYSTDIGYGSSFTLSSTLTNALYRIVIYKNQVCDNFTFYPMIRKADIEDDTYEPYHAPVTASLYLTEPIKMVGDEAEYIDYAEQKQHRVRKNLLPNTATSQTINGVTFTVNSDGSVTCNGTANDTILYEIHRFPRFSGKCILSGCPINGSDDTYQIVYSNMRNMAYREYGTGVDIYQFDETQYPASRICIRIANGYTCDNLTFYPMIRKADIEDDTYEPYITNTELDVTLPALPTVTGTNVLSVGTAVQPSRVEVKGRIKAVGQETEPEPETAEPEPETAEAEQETAEAEQETAEAEQEAAEAEQETAEAEQEAAEPEQEEPEVKEDDTDDR